MILPLLRRAVLFRCLLLTQALNLVFLVTRAASQPAQNPAIDSRILEQPITLDVRDEPMKAVLGRIEKLTGVRFQYSKQLIGAERRVSLAVVNKPLSSVLDQMLAPMHIKYDLMQEGIVLTPAPARNSIRGRVMNSKGEGLPGATIRVENTDLGVSTDVDGGFQIENVPDGPQALLISSIGYKTVRKEFTGGGEQTLELNVSMEEDQKELNEVVVVGYGTARRQDVTGAVATVNSRDFVQGQVTDPMRLIQGKVAGVQIAPSGGAPGEVGVIRIRGGSSLNASNDPLIVIDGVPVDNFGIAGAGSPLALINPNDIETFTVLKDASATAIYGSRASNGIILITTKRGIAGDKLHATASSQVSVSKNYGRLKVLNGDEYRQLTQYAAATYPDLNIDTSLVGTANTDWQKEIYRTAITTDNNISLNGSIGKKVPFRASYGYLDQQGTLKTGYMKRHTGSIGLTPMLLNDHLRIDLNLKGSQSNFRFADQNAIGGSTRFAPSQPIYSGDTLFNGYFEWIDPATGGPNQLTDRNPLAILNDKRDVSTVYRGIGNAQFNYSLHGFEDLHVNLNLGYDLTRSKGTIDVPARSSVAYNIFGLKNQYRQERDNKLLEFYLKYQKQIGDHRVEVLGGYSYQDFLRYAPSYFSLTAAGERLDTTAALPPPFKTQNTLVSFYGRLNYGFKDRYLLTATLRRDGSSHFAPGNQWGTFPAVSVAWRIGQEAFLVNSRLVSELKLRFGAGSTGQQDIFNATGTDYPFLARYQRGQASVQQQFGNLFYDTQRPAGYERNLRWEATDTYNAGLDFGLWDNRLSGSVDVYQRNTRDMIADIPVPAGSNLSNHVVTNIGSMENRGVELGLNYAVLQSRRGLNWSLNFNATSNRNRITKLLQVSDSSYVGTSINAYQIQSVDFPAYSYFLYKQRYGDDGRPVEDNVERTNMYEDLNKDGTINEKDLYHTKSPMPKVILGFSSSFGYRGFSLAFTTRANLGQYVFNAVEADRSAYTSAYPSQPFVLNALPSLLDTEFKFPQTQSDYWLRKASFLRLENVTLGYDFHALLPEIPLLRLSVAAQNVLVLTRYSGINPEVFFGIDNNIYPLPRTFTLGLTAGF